MSPEITLFESVDNRAVYLRNRLFPGDVGRVISFHGEIYGREHGLGPVFEGYVAKTVGDFALRHTGTAGRTDAAKKGNDGVNGNDKASGRAEKIWLLSQEGSLDLVGCCAVIDAGEGKAQFRWFLIDPLFRGFGLGGRLLERAIDFARSVGYRELFLFTGDFLPSAAHLYRKKGFTLTDEKPFTDWEMHFNEQRYSLPLE
ncbi:MAG: GNAT family N-acetyltransferase [Spirochaetaceae bacterium]